MNAAALIDPEYRSQVEQMPSFTLSREALPLARDRVAERIRQAPPIAVHREERFIAGPQGAPEVRVILYRPRPSEGPSPAVLYLHGGGFVLGDPRMNEGQTARVVEQIGALVVSVDYRLAPETPFPGGLEDAFAALEWLISQAEPLGVDPNRVIILGDSAGGGLAAALCLLVRDKGRFRPKAQILNYPMLDCRTGADAAAANPTTGQVVWTGEQNQFGWASLRGDYQLDDARVGYFSPALASDLTGLPPTFINVGSLDLFLDEDLAYALKLSRAGVLVECHVQPGVFHAFNILPGALSTRFNEDVISAARRFLAL